MSTFIPRDYQIKLDLDSEKSWAAGHRNIVAVSPTGSGKTKFMAMKARSLVGRGVAIAHRKELVGQISLAMAELGVPHRVLGADGTVANCIRRHVEVLRKSFVNPNASFTVASVDTLLSRADGLTQWASEIDLWMIDECHHVCTGNKWGNAVNLFPRARGLGVTATPLRADRKSLHVDQGGVFSDLVLGPTMRELITIGALSDYEVCVPPASIDRTKLEVGASGDFTPSSLRKESHKSKIVGDMVQHYRKFAAGMRTIAFAVDVEQSDEIAVAFQNAGIRAQSVSAKTPEAIRDAVISKFAKGQIDVLVNVDLFGEGFDVPAVSCVIMGRPTESYGLYVQQFGRALRPLPGKRVGLIIDMVGNFRRHGMPDAPRVWSLYSEERGKKKERDPLQVAIRQCVNEDCWKAYEAYLKCCPFCGAVPPIMGRSRPEQVDGDLVQLDARVLAEMRQAAAVAMLPAPIEVVDAKTGAMARNERERVEAQAALRDAIARWAWPHHAAGRDDSEIHRRFFFRFGTDVLSAQTLRRAEAATLTMEIESDLSAPK